MKVTMVKSYITRSVWFFFYFSSVYFEYVQLQKMIVNKYFLNYLLMVPSDRMQQKLGICGFFYSINRNILLQCRRKYFLIM